MSESIPEEIVRKVVRMMASHPNLMIETRENRIEPTVNDIMTALGYKEIE